MTGEKIKFSIATALLLLAGPLSQAAIFYPVTTGATRITDLAIFNSGVFYNDDASSKAILRLVRGPTSTFAELYLAEVATLDERRTIDTLRENFRPALFKMKLGELQARIHLRPTEADSNLYQILAVESIDPSRRLIFSAGGTVEFNVHVGGFDLGDPVIEVKRKNEEKFVIRVLETQFPASTDCKEYLL